MKTLIAILTTILVFIIVGGATLYFIGAFGMLYPLEEDPHAPFYWERSNPIIPTLNIGMGGVSVVTVEKAERSHNDAFSCPDGWEIEVDSDGKPWCKNSIDSFPTVTPNPYPPPPPPPMPKGTPIVVPTEAP